MQKKAVVAKAQEINKLKTIRDFLRWGIREFKKARLYFGHGTDNAHDEALFLILHTLHLPLDVSAKILEVKLTAAARREVINILQRRIRGRKPAAYLTHKAYFALLEFYVDERVLIPRSPLAELIMHKFAPWIANSKKIRKILDIGTGSGCFAVACAHYLPGAVVDAVDCHAAALAVAKINVARHKLGKRVHLIKSDLFAALTKKKYDVIISNPPYVASAEMRKLPNEYHHEPEEALIAGSDGLLFVERILHEAKKYLTAQGILIVEVGNSAAALLAKYPHVPFVWLEFSCGESEVLLADLPLLKKYF